MANPSHNKTLAELVHQQSVEILQEVGFCVPDAEILARFDSAGFPVNLDTQMIRMTPDLLDTALETLPRDVKLYDRKGEIPAHFEADSCFMGAGTPINVFDLHTGEHRSATRQHIRNRWIPDLTHPRPPINGQPVPEIRARAKAKIDQILAEHQPPPLDEHIRSELKTILAAAEQQFGM
jgi:trimethylamine:corrinoid methyltransferase-like protein